MTDRSTPHAEVHAHMKQFRAQRNFYIAGFALFLWLYVSSSIDKERHHWFCSVWFDFSVIKRLIGLLSAVAREMDDAYRAHKQAQDVQRHLAGSTTNDPSV